MKLSRYPDKKITSAQAMASFKMMLANARNLDQFTVESLARMYRVPVKDIEYHLTIARQNRAAAL